MKVSVVVPVFNEEKYIISCLESLKKQIEKPDEIIIVDNNCTDRTIELAKQYDVTILKEKSQGIIQARNKGFNFAHYDIIARTDADTIVPPSWIKSIKQKFENNPKLVGLSGPGKYIDERFTRLLKFPTKIYFDSFESIMGHTCFFGPNLAIRKSAWDKIKNSVCLSDKEVHEDADLAIHISKIGKVVFESRIVVTVSARRWKKIAPYIEYPYRYLKTLRKHQRAIFGEQVNNIPLRIQKAAKKLAKQFITL